MHNFLKKLDLQFFGEGASAGDGAGTGASTGVGTDNGAAAVSGQIESQTQDALEALGVPKEKADRYRSKKGNSMPVKEDPKQTIDAQPQADADPAQEENTRDYDAEWKNIQKEPEFNKRMQDTVNKRVSKMKGTIDELVPALELLSRNYGKQFDVSDPESVKALVAAITNDNSYYEGLAADMGTDVETAKRIDQREKEAARKDQLAQQTMQEQMLRNHVDSIRRQAADLQKRIPGFNLDAEMRNERFVRMTSPEGGMSVEDAFYAIHHRELEQQRINETAARTAQALSNSIQAGRSMPNENGSVSRQATNVSPKMYSQMNASERAEFKKRLKYGK